MLEEGAHEMSHLDFGMFPLIWAHLGLEGALRITSKAVRGDGRASQRTLLLVPGMEGC